MEHLKLLPLLISEGKRHRPDSISALPLMSALALMSTPPLEMPALPLASSHALPARLAFLAPPSPSEYLAVERLFLDPKEEQLRFPLLHPHQP